MDAASRLRRPIPGERIAREGRGIERIFAREEAEPRRDPVPPRDRAQARVLTLKPATRVAPCRPNAPLLIRIVRYPFALAKGRAERRRYLEDGAPFERIDWSVQVAEALADRVRLRFTSAARKRPMPFAVRPSAWTLLPPDSDPSKHGDER